MHTIGLVVTLTNDPEQSAAAVAELAAAGTFTIGEPSGGCYPVVLETPDPESAREWHEWTAARPGVEAVDVVFVHWDADPTEPEECHADR